MPCGLARAALLLTPSLINSTTTFLRVGGFLRSFRIVSVYYPASPRHTCRATLPHCRGVIPLRPSPSYHRWYQLLSACGRIPSLVPYHLCILRIAPELPASLRYRTAESRLRIASPILIYLLSKRYRNCSIGIYVL